MTQIDRLRALGLFDSRVPRYTSYPTAPVFTPQSGTGFQTQALAALDPAEPVSVYIHIPFCERLCWFCACRTQGTQTLSPVESYLGTLERELDLVRRVLPDGVRMGRMHWGGGTPTILPPEMIHRLAGAVKAVIPPADGWEFSVEIDPTMVDRAKIAALAGEGMNRASIGIQDFDPLVQAAIGRIQPYDVTRDCVEDLRDAGIASLNADLVYGLPHQDEARISATVDQVLRLAPDRVALFGYAHVPWVSKRQKLIDEAALPGDMARYRLSELAATRFRDAGYAAIGIDHFARPGDGLERAARSGRLRRNFQGYTDDTCGTLIGLGASSISRFAEGYVQNAPATAAYAQRIEAGQLAGTKGHVMSADDRLRGRAIEMLMCDFRLDRRELRARFGSLSATLDPTTALIEERFGDLVTLTDDALTILRDGHAVARIIASSYDAHVPEGVRYSRAT
ncbi:oxygen-independent coproporphyrinogen III oxidase [Defluviimonas salinarum]|uniref:Coproporphyrinogen-III oxidase n=1 Tax=Defluviimonas salinarum TaxID=2992147 RepID=A0ABT3J9N7_9RHOB|nr:oxygen-independent coproporphyrinogen III oxidase [Defluviimonas salinarum]MCW3784408.1 oxygen-independent coproporphyrinogen III oxidase [Defluviimonas salinarum]